MVTFSTDMPVCRLHCILPFEGKVMDKKRSQFCIRFPRVQTALAIYGRQVIPWQLIEQPNTSYTKEEPSILSLLITHQNALYSCLFLNDDDNSVYISYCIDFFLMVVTVMCAELAVENGYF